MTRPRPASDPAWLRPSEAARLLGVSERTLRRWAAVRWIGQSKVGRVLFYRAADLYDLLAAHETPRRVAAAVQPETAPDRSWENTAFWRKQAAR